MNLINKIFKKDKKINIINFGKGCWGRDIGFDEALTTTTCKMHGWYSNLLFNYNNNNNNNDNHLKIGSLIIKEIPQGFWYGRIKKIEWCNDPKDMFFAIVKTITKDKMLSQEEMKYLIDNNLINL